MTKDQRTGNIQGIEFKVIYSSRRSLGISVLPDSSVIVRVPNRTTDKTISRIVNEKASWIIKHRDNYIKLDNSKLKRLYAQGEIHLFRGQESVLRVEKSARSYIRFFDSSIELGLAGTDDTRAIKSLLYKGYKNETMRVGNNKVH